MDTGPPGSFCLGSKSKPDLLWEAEPACVGAESNLSPHAEVPLGSEMHQHNMWLLDWSWLTSEQWEYKRFPFTGCMFKRAGVRKRIKRNHFYFFCWKRDFRHAPTGCMPRSSLVTVTGNVTAFTINCLCSIFFLLFYNLTHSPAPFS